MKTSENGINLIKQFEGCRLSAYLDAVGVPTIGYGHIEGVLVGMTITKKQAEEFLKSDLAKYEKAVSDLERHYSFNQNEFDALVSFSFNLGVNNLMKLTAYNKRNKGAIADAMLLYNKAGGKVLKGLTERRLKERALFCTPWTGETVPVIEKVYTMPKGTIKEGSTGDGVKWVQTKLNEKGYNLKVDGIAGKKTVEAIIDFQSKNGLIIDGIVGKDTKALLK